MVMTGPKKPFKMYEFLCIDPTSDISNDIFAKAKFYKLQINEEVKNV